MGSKIFVEKIRRWIGKKPKDLKQIPQAKSYIRPDLKTCLEMVGRVYGREEKELKRSRRGERNEARSIAMYICRKMSGMGHEAIAQEFGVGGYSAVSSMIGRTESELKKGGAIVVQFKKIRDLLGT